MPSFVTYPRGWSLQSYSRCTVRPSPSTSQLKSSADHSTHGIDRCQDARHHKIETQSVPRPPSTLTDQSVTPSDWLSMAPSWLLATFKVTATSYRVFADIPHAALTLSGRGVLKQRQGTNKCVGLRPITQGATRFSIHPLRDSRMKPRYGNNTPLDLGLAWSGRRRPCRQQELFTQLNISPV
jgi:hypothetical protein